MDLATKMQLLVSGSSSGLLQKNQSVATLTRPRSADARGATPISESSRRSHLGIRARLVRSADSNCSSPSPLNTNQDRPAALSGNSQKPKRSASHRCQVLNSALEAHLLTQIQTDTSRAHQDRSEPEQVVNEEAEGAFQVPVGNLRALLRLWDIDNDKTNYHELLGVADYLERLGLDVYFRLEVKAILDRVFRVWTENSLTETAEILGDLQDVGLAFYLLRSHGYDIQPSVFRLYKREDGSFSKTPQQGSGQNIPNADVADLLNLLRASDLKFRSDAILHDAYNFASTALTSLLDGAQPPLSEKASAEVNYRLTYPWVMNFRMLETRQTVVNFELEKFTARFSSPRLSSEVISLMLSTASQLFNHYHSAVEKELEVCTRWSEETGCAAMNVRPAMIIRPFHLGYAYEMPQAKFAYTRDVWAKSWYLMILQDDLYEGVASYTMDEILIFMDAFRKFDPKLLEKIPNIEDEKYRFMKVVYRTMYDLTTSCAEESSKWYGRDLLRTFIDTWMVRLEVYRNEKRWVDDKYKFTAEEYLEEYGKWSFAIETGCPIAYYSIPGYTLSPSFFETRPDMEALFAMAKTARFLNDARSFEHEVAEDECKPELIKLFMEEDPKLTLEDAVKKTHDLAISSLEDSTEIYLRTQAPPVVKQILLSSYKTIILMYISVDGLRSGDWPLGALCDPLPTLTTES